MSSLGALLFALCALCCTASHRAGHAQRRADTGDPSGKKALELWPGQEAIQALADAASLLQASLNTSRLRSERPGATDGGAPASGTLLLQTPASPPAQPQRRSPWGLWLAQLEAQQAVDAPFASHSIELMALVVVLVPVLVVAACAGTLGTALNAGIIGGKGSEAASASPKSSAQRMPVLHRGLLGPRASLGGEALSSGIALTVHGLVEPHSQDGSLDVSVGFSTGVTLRMLLSESSADGGVLLETVSPRLPVAFLNTGPCVQRSGSWRALPGHHSVAISQLEPGTWARAPFPFAAAWAIRGQFEVRAGAGASTGADPDTCPPEGSLLLAVRLDAGARAGTMVDARGALVAAMETRASQGGGPSMLLHVSAGADAGLVLCAMIAAIKLH